MPVSKILVDKESGVIHDIVAYVEPLADELIEQHQMVPTAKDDFIEHACRELVLHDGRLVQKDSGLNWLPYMTEVVQSESKAHWRPAKIETDFAREAFGEGSTLAGRARFISEYGTFQYEETMKAWGASPQNLKPGTPPAGTEVSDKPDPSKGGFRNNPWATLRLPNGEICPKAQARCESIIASMGTKVAAGMAKSAGMQLNGLPLRK